MNVNWQKKSGIIVNSTLMSSQSCTEIWMLCHTFFSQIRVEVSGAKTQELFDHVFDKMVAAAQPIPGFRREKGGNIITH